MSAGHVRRRTTNYEGKGWVAWCSCGIGSPPKPSKDEAEQSLQAHVANPAELPR